MREDVLFWEYDWFGVVEAQKRAVQRDIDSLSDRDFENATTDEIVASVCEKFSLRAPTLDRENITVKQREVDIERGLERRGYFSDHGSYTVKGTAIDVRVPFDGDKEMFKVKPTTFTTVIPRGRIDGNSLLFTISGTDLTTDNVKSEIERRLNEVQQWLDFQSKSVGNFPTELSQIAKQAVDRRKDKLDADRELVSGLGFRTE